MPELDVTPTELIDLFGRHLPTAEIDVIRIRDIPENDEMYEAIAEHALNSNVRTAYTNDAGSALMPIDGVDSLDPAERLISLSAPILDPDSAETDEGIITDAPGAMEKMVRLDVDITIRANTFDGFKPEILTHELFRLQSSFDGTDDESLYINLLVAKKSGTIAGLKESRLNLKSFITPNDDWGNNWLESQNIEFDAPGGNGTTNEYLMGQYLLEMIAGTSYYTVSVPLSNFLNTVQLTTSFDKDNNAIITLSNMTLTAYIKDFVAVEDLTLFVTISAGNPTMLGGEAPLSKLAYALNFSDVVYEDIVRGGQIATYGEDAFVDATGNYYANVPMMSINKRFYKTDSYGIPQILQGTKALMEDYEEYALTNGEMRDALDMVMLAMLNYNSSPRLLMRLNEIGSAFPYAEDSYAAQFGERFRILVSNMNALLTEQHEVVRRKFKNYKIIDARSWESPQLDATSYVEDWAATDFLYEHIWQTNIANYVPVQEGGVDYPFKSELPYSPAERDAALTARLDQIKREIVEAMQVSYTDAGDDRFGDMGKLLKITQRVGKSMLDWVWWRWSSTFFSFYTQFGNSTQNAGFQVCVANWGQKSGESRKKYGCWKNPCSDGAPKDGCPATRRALYGALQDWVSRFGSNQTGRGGFAEAFNIIDPNDSLSWHYMYGYSATGPSDDAGQFTGYDGGEEMFMPERVAPGDPALYQGNAGATGCARSYYIGGYLYHNCTREELFCINKWLIEEPYQIQCYVPKTKVAPDGGLYPVGNHFAGDMGADYTGRISEAGGALGHLSQWMDQSIELVGGLNPIRGQVLDDSGSGNYTHWHGFAYDISDRDDIGNTDWDLWSLPTIIALYRNHKRQILAQIDHLLAGILGLNASGPGWSEYDYDVLAAFDLSGDQTPDEYSLGDFAYDLQANEGSITTSKIDDYLANMPTSIANMAVNKLFEGLTAMDTSNLEDPDDRERISQGFFEGFYGNIEQAIDRYINDSGVLSIWLVNAIPTQNGIGNIPAYTWATSTHGVNYLTWNSYIEDGRGEGDGGLLMTNVEYACKVKWTASRQLGYQDGETVYGRALYGDWAAAERLRSYHNDSVNRSGLKWVDDDPRTGELWTDRNRKYQCFNMASDVTDYLWSAWTNQSVKNTIHEKIREYMDVLSVYNGVTMDTGICSTLSEVDIVVKKYGYFFFDLEKFIRKNSFLSRYMNVDRFMRNIPAAKALTNEAVTTSYVEYNNMVPYGSTTAGVKLALTYPNESSERAYGYDWEKLEFDTSMRPMGGNRPYAYNKVSALQNIDFDSITGWTNESQGYTGGNDIEDDSVRFDGAGGLNTSDHAPTNQYSYLVQRAYGFPGFNDLALGAGKSWVKDYRLMCFNYQFYVDDDVALQETPLGAWGTPGPPEWPYNTGDSTFNSVSYEGYEAGTSTNDEYDMNAPLDKVTIKVNVTDDTFQILEGLVSWIEGLEEEFNEKYVELAKEACVFDEFTWRFNDFFVEEMLSSYPDLTTSPWFEMVAGYTIMLNIFTDTFGGLDSEMVKSANNTIEQIRPETGTLDALIEWHDSVKEFIDNLKTLRETAFSEQTDADRYRSFVMQTEEQNIIIDHVGNYTQESSDSSFMVE